MPARPSRLARPPAHRRGPRGARALLISGVALLWITGVALWLGAPDREASEAIAAWHHPAFVVHLLLAWAAVFALGRWAWPHVADRAPGRRRRLSGWSHAAVWLVVTATGLALQVLPETPRAASALAHWWLGLSLPVLAMSHLPRRRRRHRSGRLPAAATAPHATSGPDPR